MSDPTDTDDDIPAMESAPPDLGETPEAGGELTATEESFEPATLGAAGGAPGVSRRRAIFDVPVEVVVSVGRAKPMIGSLLDLKRDSLIPLDSRMEDPVEIFVGDRVIARGELQELPEEGGRLGVRLTEIVEGGVLG